MVNNSIYMVGRPVKWQSAEDMQVAIDLYFNEIQEHNLNNENKKHPTVTGLALALDMTREGLLHYINKNEQFADTIKKAKAKVEEYIEQRLYMNNATGCIFNLKNNFGWKDSSELDLGNKDKEAFRVDATISPADAYAALIGKK